MNNLIEHPVQVIKTYLSSLSSKTMINEVTYTVHSQQDMFFMNLVKIPAFREFQNDETAVDVEYLF